MTTKEDPAAEVASEYAVTHQFTHLGGNIERIAREIAFTAFLDGAMWRQKRDLEIWKDKRHTYCDFYYDGKVMIDPKEQEEWQE